MTTPFIAARGVDVFYGDKQALFGIVQGGMYADLRAESARVGDTQYGAGDVRCRETDLRRHRPRKRAAHVRRHHAR